MKLPAGASTGTTHPGAGGPISALCISSGSASWGTLEAKRAQSEKALCLKRQTTVWLWFMVPAFPVLLTSPMQPVQLPHKITCTVSRAGLHGVTNQRPVVSGYSDIHSPPPFLATFILGLTHTFRVLPTVPLSSCVTWFLYLCSGTISYWVGRIILIYGHIHAVLGIC